MFHHLKEGFVPLFLFAKICQNYVKALHIIFKSSFRNLTHGVRISIFKQQKLIAFKIIVRKLLCFLDYIYMNLHT